MFAIRVSENARDSVCNNNNVWVKDRDFTYYCSEAERGTWDTYYDAEQEVVDPWEEVVAL